MKKINIRQIGIPDKFNKSHYIKMNMYDISLGNGVKEYFTSMKEAKRYLAITNRFLNSKLHEANSLLSDCYSEYRKNWFYFTSENLLANKEIIKLENKIRSNLGSTDKELKLLVERSHWINGNHFAFHHLNNISDYLVCIIDNLQIVCRRRKDYSELKLLEFNKLYAMRLGYSVMNYGKKEVKIPEFEYSELPEDGEMNSDF